ncbi:MAG: ATP-binding protein, partial [Leeuwenhoekiella sp.]
VGATLTAAIVSNDKLWGLIACHHYSPRFLNYYHRLSCKFLTQVFSTQLVLRSTNSILKKVNNSTRVRAKLIEQISQNWNITEGLSSSSLTLLDICDASGAAIIIDEKITLLGDTLSEIETKELLDFIANSQDSDVFYTNHLSALYPQAYEYKETASGVLCVFTSKLKKDALIWFKPEIKQTVTWAGNPQKAVEMKDDERLSPRKSFEKWSEEQDAQSASWDDYEIAAAKALKQSITEVIIQKYEEVKLLNDKLKKAYEELESFSYSISHDLRAPLRGIDGFAQIIKEDYYDNLDEYGKSAIETIINSTDKMNELIDDILAFSGLSQKEVRSGVLSLNDVVKDVIILLNTKQLYPKTTLKVAPDLPDSFGDKSLVIQLISNLLGNALKYSAKRENPLVEIGYLDQENAVYYIKDNGIGFDLKHKDKIFGVFNRLVGNEYEGSGIGLSIAKRVVEKHNGNIWVESQVGAGTTFYFTFNS